MAKVKTPIVRRPIESDIHKGTFSPSTLMHLAHYDRSAKYMIDEAACLNRPIDVVNIGCGDMWDLRVLVNGTYVKKETVLRSYIAVDIETQSSPFGASLGSLIHFQSIARDLQQDSHIPIDDACIDVALCTEFIEHIDKNAGIALLQELYRTMRSGALLYITTPNASHSMHTDRYHIYEWELFELLSQLEACGFDIESTYGTHIYQKAFDDANAKLGYVPNNLVDDIKSRFTPNFWKVFLATPYPEYSNEIAIVARK